MSLVLLAAGTAMSALSAIQQGQAASAQAKAQGAALTASGRLAQMEAEAAKKAGKYEETKLAKQKAAMLSAQRARYAKAGVSFLSGSPLAVMAETATEYEMDIAAQRYNTAIQTAQKRYESRYYGTMGEYYSGLFAKAQRTAGYTKAGATLLTGGYNVMRSL